MSGGKDFQAAIVCVLRDHGLLPAAISAAELPNAALAVVGRLASAAGDTRAALAAAGVVFTSGYPRVLYGGDGWRLIWRAEPALWSSVPSKEVGAALAELLRSAVERPK